MGSSPLPRWVEVWGPVVVILGATWMMIQGVEGRIDRLEDGLTARIERLEATVAENGQAIARLEVRMQRVEDDVTWLRNNTAPGEDR